MNMWRKNGGGKSVILGQSVFFCDMCLPAISLFTMFKEGSSWLIEKWICFKIRDSNPIWWNLLNGTPIPGILKGPNGNLTHPQMEILWLTIQLRDHWNLWHFSDENHWGDKGYYMLPYFCCHFIPLQVQCTWQWNSPTPHVIGILGFVELGWFPGVTLRHDVNLHWQCWIGIDWISFNLTF